jgi:hypothetical protein
MLHPMGAIGIFLTNVYLSAHSVRVPSYRAEGLHLSAQTPLPGFFASEAPKGDVLQMAYPSARPTPETSPLGTPHRGDFQAHTNLLCLSDLSIGGNMEFNNRLFTLTWDSALGAFSWVAGRGISRKIAKDVSKVVSGYCTDRKLFVTLHR